MLTQVRSSFCNMLSYGGWNYSLSFSSVVIGLFFILSITILPNDSLASSAKDTKDTKDTRDAKEQIAEDVKIILTGSPS